jgi:hypothetical protein
VFVESKTGDEQQEGTLERFGRKHPGQFTALLILLAAGVTIGLLLKPSYTLVLYQGF